MDGKKNEAIFLNEFEFHTLNLFLTFRIILDHERYVGLFFLFSFCRVGLEGECRLLRSSRLPSESQGRVMLICWLPFFHSVFFSEVTLTLKHSFFVLCCFTLGVGVGGVLLTDILRKLCFLWIYLIHYLILGYPNKSK